MRLINGRNEIDFLLSFVLLFLFSFYLDFTLPVYFINMGGDGLLLPQNIICWNVILLATGIVVAGVIIKKEISFNSHLLLCSLGVLLLIVPWFWTTYYDWKLNSATHMLGLMFSLFLLFSLFQVQFNNSVKTKLLAIILFSIFIQSILGCIQMWLPNLAKDMMEKEFGAPYGIFQQRNLYGSYLAIAVGISLYFMSLPKSRLLKWAGYAVLFPVSTQLLFCQSRIGMLSASCIAILYLAVRFGKKHFSSINPLKEFLLLAIVVIWAYAIYRYSNPFVSLDFVHASSNNSRLNVILACISLIIKNPVFGNGYGSFEYLIVDSLKNSDELFTHPHNEFLYVLAEGGVVGLIGLAILSFVWLNTPYKLYCTNNKSIIWSSDLPPIGNKLKMPNECFLSLLGLPIVLHLFTEYPLYASTPHLLVLILLFRIGMPESYINKQHIIKKKNLGIYSLSLLLLLISTGMFLLSNAFIAQKQLSIAERDMISGRLTLMPEKKWQSVLQFQRLDYDQHMASLLSYNKDRNESTLLSYQNWADRFLSVHHDAKVYAAAIAIAKHSGNSEKASSLRMHACSAFPNNVLFQCKNNLVMN